MKLSPETKQRLIRYANAVKRYETGQRRIYFQNDEHVEEYTEAPPSSSTISELVNAREELKICPEPKIKRLVYLTQIERLDEAFKCKPGKERSLKAGEIEAAYRIADNELVALGHKLQGTQLSKTIKARIQRRKARKSR